MYPVPAGPPAYYDDQVALFDLLERRAPWKDSDVTAEDERVAYEILVEEDGAVRCGYPHPVAVVSDSGYDALHDSFGMQAPLR